MIVGMDFGTTNSGMAVFDGQDVRLLPLDPANSNPNVARTALYITNDQSISIGRQAIDRYFDENVGRPVKMQKVWVGEVEVYGADMFYVTDVYTWTDVLSPGRLFLSVKSGLRDPDYQGTVVGQSYYSLEDLIAIYLRHTKARAERLLERELTDVVLGRPVIFSTDDKADVLAQRRLLEAAFRAGYKNVYLQYEPIAAAYHYAAGVDQPQNVLIFDFGGGTLDITVMRVDGYGGRDVLATGGIPVAGDIFDQKLVRAKLPRHFGEGTRYGPIDKRLPLPKWIYDVFSNWQTIIELQTPQSRQLLGEIAQTADNRAGIEALISLVSNNYALKMFDMVEAAKRRLSADMATIIRFHGPDFRVSQMITRSEFENIIRAEIMAIEQRVDETVRAAGLVPEQINAVVRTGGSAQIPVFRYMLLEKFGRTKVLESDTFSSVTSGLGIIAHRIESGEAITTIGGRPFTRADLPERKHNPADQRVPNINLELLWRRLAAREERSNGQPAGRQLAWFTVMSDYDAVTLAQPADKLDQDATIPLKGTDLLGKMPARSALLADLEDPLLLVTSRYRFLLTSAGNLVELRAMGMGIGSYFQLKSDEHLCVAGHYPSIKSRPYLVLVSTRGFTRAYDLSLLVEGFEGPTPLLFDQPLPGLPAALLGASANDQLVIVLDSGRAVRYPIKDLPLRGIQAINRRDDEEFAGAVITQPEDELLLATTGGYGKRLRTFDIPSPPKANSRGRVIIARRPVAGVARKTPSNRLWALLPGQLVPLLPGRLPLEGEASTRSHRLLKLGRGEAIRGIIEQVGLTSALNKIE